jgi:hypothetical protein
MYIYITCSTRRRDETSIQNLEGGDHLGDLSVDDRIILKSKFGSGYGLYLTGSECGPMAGYCKDGNEISVSIKGGEFLG